MTLVRELWARALVLALVAVVLWLVLDVFGLANATTKEWMDAHVRTAGLRGAGLYVLAVAALTAVGVPRQLCSTLGGYVFGVLGGTLLATVGTGLACALCFGCARYVGQEVIARRFDMQLHWFNDFICQSPFTLTVMVRIVPLGSNFLTNLIAGVSRIPALPFLTGSVLGFTAQNFIFAFFGSGLAHSSPAGTLCSAALYAVSLYLGYRIYRRYHAHHQTMNGTTTTPCKNA